MMARLCQPVTVTHEWGMEWLRCGCFRHVVNGQVVKRRTCPTHGKRKRKPKPNGKGARA